MGQVNCLPVVLSLSTSAPSVRGVVMVIAIAHNKVKTAEELYFMFQTNEDVQYRHCLEANLFL